LFAAGRGFVKGDVICEYLGVQMERSVFDSLPSAYGVQLHRGVLDARRTCDGFGRYANAAPGARDINSQLISERKLIGRRGAGSRIFLQATRTIRDGEEILLQYEWRPLGSR
jgi:hypothetical protein